MPATTPNLALPYPLGTDPVSDGDDAIKALAEALDLKTPRSVCRRRVATGNHVYTNVTAYTPLTAVPADQTALTANVIKRAVASKLVIRMAATLYLQAGASQALYIGMRQAAVDYEVGIYYPVGNAPQRGTIAGLLEVTGLAAGTYGFQPVIRGSAANSLQLIVNADWISWEIEEIY